MPKELIRKPVWKECFEQKNGMVWRWQVGTYTCIVLKGKVGSLTVEVRSRHDKATNISNLQKLLENIVDRLNMVDYLNEVEVRECVTEAVVCMLNLPPDIEKAATEY